MKQSKLLLKLLPGFLPLFVFIAADEIWGTRIGLLVALGTGLIELVFYRIKDKKFDKFILFDTLLIMVLGGISMLLDNDVFFKLKPALIGVLTCAVLGISAFTPSNILMNMSKRYIRNMEFNAEQDKLMRRSIKSMFYLFSVYTLLVFYSVWFMSNEAWAFISGGLFYILFGVYALYEFIRNRMNMSRLKKEEQLPVMNEKGMVIGSAPRSVCHSNKNYLHPVVHMHIFNKNGEIFLQKRADHKKVQPGKWDTAVGGHVAAGEKIETALAREVEEESGIHEANAQLFAKYVWESEIEREYVFCYICQHEGEIRIQEEEISEGKFWHPADIQKNLKTGVFTPNFEYEFENLLTKLYKAG